ncbi:hypothetical protein [Hyphomicrobium sp. ghe19]|uniref:hypothetical protein n=1 Tax=Hyphomicrobium sp. ghe19 TaxID=2682968 RepID=UPI001366D5C4|nr:hypothetical protein HYPP_01931 [Hyphomicrobium sp. ghe19]
MRIEAGKWYLNREGNCVGPMQRDDDGITYFWRDGDGRSYFFDGRAGVGSLPSPHDLIREWINPAASAEPPMHDLVKRPATNTPPPIPPQYPSAEQLEADRSYDVLVSVLKDAHAQASRGKGKERHANGRPFERQPIMELGRMYGPGFAAGQAAKKAQEAMGMVARGERDAAAFELLGAINYLAACVMLIRENQNAA